MGQTLHCMANNKNTANPGLLLHIIGVSGAPCVAGRLTG